MQAGNQVGMQLYPAIDLRAGCCVRLYQGDFTQETHYSGAPEKIAADYAAAGADWLHLVDLDGARSGTSANLQAIADIAAGVACRLQAGGGVRSDADVDRLLGAGVSRVVVGSLAVSQPQTVRDWLQRYGGEHICIAFDVREQDGDYRLATHGWTQSETTTLQSALQSWADSGLRHVLCTDIGRDGTLAGPNLDLYRRCTAEFPDILWQASGGVRDLGSIRDLAGTGVDGAVVGRALLEGGLHIEEALSCSRAA